MKVLPIKLISKEEKEEVGENLYNLVKLAQANFPVSKGLVVFPPTQEFKRIFEHFPYLNSEILSSNSDFIEEKLNEILIYPELKDELNGLNAQKIWQELLKIFYLEVRKKVAREHHSFTKNWLRPQPILFLDKINASGTIHIDPETKDSVIKVDKALPPVLMKELDELVFKMDKRVFIPQIYSFVVDKERIKITKVTPFTHKEKVNLIKQVKSSFNLEPQKKKLAIKIFSEIDQAQNSSNLDGVLINCNQQPQLEKEIERLIGITTLPAVFKLPADTHTLINNQKLLKTAVSAFLFARNKKQLKNLQLAIPLVRSEAELMQIKRDLASLGVYRKGTLKLWMEVAVPENLVNIDEYLNLGIDGLILELDKLSLLLRGVKEEDAQEMNFYAKDIKPILQLIEPTIKACSKAGLPVLVIGKLTLDHDMLKFLIEKRVFGIVISSVEAENLNEYLYSLTNNALSI